MIKPHKFPVLDGLRGVAALLVLIMHEEGRFGRQYFPQGHLAVDFFFILSGFVLSHAYQGRLDSGWKLSEFLEVRFIRLYPLYFLGLLLGIVSFALLSHTHHQSLKPAFWGAVVFGTLLIPSPASFGGGVTTSFPFNGPSWSVFMELAVNLFHALFLRRKSLRFLGMILAISGPIFWVAALISDSTSIGGAPREIFMLYGFSRVIFCYVMGLVLFRLWKFKGARLQVHPVFLIAAFVAALAAPLTGRMATVTDLLLIVTVFPVLVLAGASATLTRGVFLSTLAGEASYAVYAVHLPLLPYVQALWTRVRGHDIDADKPWSGIFYAVLVFALAIVLDRVYDLPLRAFLRRKVMPTRLSA